MRSDRGQHLSHALTRTLCMYYGLSDCALGTAGWHVRLVCYQQLTHTGPQPTVHGVLRVAVQVELQGHGLRVGGLVGGLHAEHRGDGGGVGGLGCGTHAAQVGARVLRGRW